MNDTTNTTDELLADYLSEEMTPAQARAFEARMETDPSLARRAVSLKTTLRTVEQALSGRSVEARRNTGILAALHRYANSAMPYAAVAALAFASGILAHGFMPHVRMDTQVTPLIAVKAQPDPTPEQLAELKVDSGLARGILQFVQQ